MKTRAFIMFGEKISMVKKLDCYGANIVMTIEIRGRNEYRRF